jgi:hypothetical protein
VGALVSTADLDIRLLREQGLPHRLIPLGEQVPFFEFFHNGGRTDVQHACGIAKAADLQGYIDYLLLHLR